MKSRIQMLLTSAYAFICAIKRQLLILKVYLVVGGWTSPGWTDSTETLVEGGSAWTLHTGSLPDGGFGDCGILYYNNVLYLFGGEESPPSGGYRDRQGRVKHCRGSLY